MRLLTPIRVMALALLVAACGGSPASGAPEPKRDQNVITLDELSQETTSNVFEAIQHLRPQMLRVRGGAGSASLSGNSSYQIQVYLGGAKIGTLDALRDISVSTVREIRYLDAAEATQRYGTGNSGGAIVLTPR